MAYRQKDHYYRRAKKEGYASRAAYKLIDIDRKYQFLFPGARVVELGCCPGGWSQIIIGKVGPGGRVFGVDRLPRAHNLPKGLVYISADLTDASDRERLGVEVGDKVDLILSDMAPDTTGIGFRDRHLSYELALGVLEVGRLLLRRGGHILLKIFAGEEMKMLISTLKGEFEKVITIVPSASRQGSSEQYILARSFRGSNLSKETNDVLDKK